MPKYQKEQKVCTIGGIKVGGQPGENPPLLIGNMFQKGDTLIESRKEGRFRRNEAGERIREMECLSRETGLPGMVSMVANSLAEWKTYVDFFISVTDMPFALDIWKPEVRLAAARYIAERGLQERVLYNSITPWDEDISGQVAGLKELGIRHVVVQAFDMADKSPQGRIKSLERMLPLVEKGNFRSILVDTAVMNLPFTAFSLVANRLVKERFGLPAGCAPANGTYMWRKGLKDRSDFPAVDAAVEAVAAMGSDFIFYGPMSGTRRVFSSVAAAISILAAQAYAGGMPLPPAAHPLNRLFPDAVQQLSKEEGKK